MEHIVVDAVIDKVLATYVIGLPCCDVPAHHHFDGIRFGAFRLITVTVPSSRKICLAREFVETSERSSGAFEFLDSNRPASLSPDTMFLSNSTVPSGNAGGRLLRME